jgi:hypothetical protein
MSENIVKKDEKDREVPVKLGAQAISRLGGGLATILTQSFAPYLNGLGDTIGAAVVAGVNAIGENAEEAWEHVKNGLQNTLDAYANQIYPGDLIDGLRELIDEVRKATNAMDQLREMGSGLTEEQYQQAIEDGIANALAKNASGEAAGNLVAAGEPTDSAADGMIPLTNADLANVARELRGAVTAAATEARLAAEAAAEAARQARNAAAEAARREAYADKLNPDGIA